MKMEKCEYPSNIFKPLTRSIADPGSPMNLTSCGKDVGDLKFIQLLQR